MKPFTQIAIPHDDILKGNLTMDVFAADLWQVVNKKAPLDYQDAELFFEKTYQTKGLKNILNVVDARLKGKSGDSVIQLQTPFGGGKTHTLIALYHRTKQWNANAVVFDGTALNPNSVTPWEELERQLTGKIDITKGRVSPGKDILLKIISENSPILILIDELLAYVTKAAGVKVGDSTLASQVLVFVQELTGAVATAGNALLVLTLPSSVLEHYDENAERMFNQLQKIIGRTERIYTPVADDEIEHIIRKRIFNKIQEKEAKKIINKFVEYAKNEGLLANDEVAEYREKFIKSYPFKPEVIETLYKRWGSFPTFQRTRGVLRLLSLVVYVMIDKSVPFIRLGDFDFANDEIKRGLIKHIGEEWNSIIAQDITSLGSGAKKVDNELGSSYKPYKLGTVISTTIFMLSFSGRGEKDVSIKDIKLATVYPEFSSTVIDTAISNLKEKLFYISDEGLYFTNQPNLNRIILSKEENVSPKDIEEQEKKLVKKYLGRPSKVKVYTYPRFSKDIPDTSELKLIVLDTHEPNIEFFEKCGESPRIYKNSLLFLCIDREQRTQFYRFLRKILGLKSLEQEKNLKLTDAQKKEIKKKLKDYEQREYEELRRLYRKIFVPTQNGFKEIDLGLPTYGETSLDREIYEALRSKGEILEKISPKVIKEKYLTKKEYIKAKVLYDAFLRTPGEIRLVSKDSFIESIKEGVKNKFFGYGYLENNTIKCKVIGDTPDVELTDGEIIIKADSCIKKSIEEDQVKSETLEDDLPKPSLDDQEIEESSIQYSEKQISNLTLKLKVPIGQISTVIGIANYLNLNFDRCEVKITIVAEDGKLKQTEYEDKIMEALMQAGIEIIEENKG